MSEERAPLFIIVVGDIESGFSHIGPFDSKRNARRYADGQNEDFGPWRLIELEDPEGEMPPREIYGADITDADLKGGPDD